MSAEIALAGITGAAVFFLLWFLRALLKESRRFKPGHERRIEAPFLVIPSDAPPQGKPAAIASRIQRGA